MVNDFLPKSADDTFSVALWLSLPLNATGFYLDGLTVIAASLLILFLVTTGHMVYQGFKDYGKT